MKKDLIKGNDKPIDEPIVIADECGDSMWDAVLEQQEKACGLKEVSKNAASLLNKINIVKVCDATEA